MEIANELFAALRRAAASERVLNSDNLLIRRAHEIDGAARAARAEIELLDHNGEPSAAPQRDAAERAQLFFAFQFPFLIVEEALLDSRDRRQRLLFTRHAPNPAAAKVIIGKSAVRRGQRLKIDRNAIEGRLFGDRFETRRVERAVVRHCAVENFLQYALDVAKRHGRGKDRKTVASARAFNFARGRAFLVAGKERNRGDVFHIKPNRIDFAAFRLDRVERGRLGVFIRLGRFRIRHARVKDVLNNDDGLVVFVFAERFKIAVLTVVDNFNVFVFQTRGPFANP